MSKEKQTSSERTGADLTNGLIDIGNGVKMDTRLRVEGMLYLEDEFDCPLGKIKFSEDGRVQSMMPLFVALVLQANDGMTSEIAEQHVRSMDASTMFTIASEIPKMMAIPEAVKKALTENPPTPVTETPPETES